MHSSPTNLWTCFVSVLLGLAPMACCPEAPKADFAARPLSGAAPLTVQFTNRSSAGSSPISSCSWQFGDGETSTQENCSHTYTMAGAYSVSLTVASSAGENTRTRDDHIAVADPSTPISFVKIPELLSGDNPRYLTQAISAPAPGQNVVDPGLGLAQMRVTKNPKLRHEYARFDPFNADGSLVLLQYFPDGDWRVYRTDTIPYDAVKEPVRSLSLEEPRWDLTDPNVMWGTRDFSILRMNVLTGETTTVKNFADDAAVKPVLTAEPDLYRITTRDEGEASRDRRYWAFMIQGMEQDYRPRYLLVWDRQKDEILALRPVSVAEKNIDWVGMSPNGQYVILGADPANGGDIPGLTMANHALTSFHLMAYAGGHGDVGLDSQGKEVYVVQNARTDYIDLIPLDTSILAVEESDDYPSSGTIPLVRLYYDSNSPIGFNSGVHISCNYPGWCVISTYTEPGVPEQNWLDRSIILVRLDRAKPRAWYLAKVHGTCAAYWEETHASISADGSKVVWATNWGVDPGQEKVWLAQLNMPAGWQGILNP